MYACGSDRTCTRVFRSRYFLYDSGGNIAKIAGKRGELLSGRTQNFFLCEKMSKQGEWKWKVDDDDVTVGVIECSRVSQVGEGREGKTNVLEVSGRFHGGEGS